MQTASEAGTVQGCARRPTSVAFGASSPTGFPKAAAAKNTSPVSFPSVDVA